MLAHMAFEQMLLRSGEAESAIVQHPAYDEKSTSRMVAVDKNLARRNRRDPNDSDPERAGSQQLGGREARGSTALQIKRESNYIAAAIAARGLMFSNKQEALAEIRRLVFQHFGMGTASIGGAIELGD